MKYRTIAAGVLGAAWTLAGCAVSTDSPPAPIPAPMAETIPRPPVSPDPMIWQAGHWNWTGNGDVWIPGQYVAADGHGNQWMSGLWERTDSGWVWHPAHWM